MTASKPLFSVKPVDMEHYRSRLRDFLPDRIVDIHTHVYRAQDLRRRDLASREKERRLVTWPSRVASENPIEHLVETYRLMFPDKTVTPLIFPTVGERADFDALNAYVAQVARREGFPALLFADPLWDEDEFERKIEEGGFLGAKVYLSTAPAYIPADEIRIFDFIPHHQLEVLHRRGWILMLHIPRSGRLGDPVNLAQMLEIERLYPRCRTIIAHVGRAYCSESVGNAFDVLADTEHLMFDISANTNEEVFRGLIETVGPRRILFGSDLPVARMRMRRVCEKGVYVNIVPPGLYGDVSGDPHLREAAPDEAEKLSFFMYEIIEAFHKAAEKTGLSRADIEDVFFNNAQRLLPRAGA